MPKRRTDIAMSAEEQEAFLREGHTLQVATNGPDGHPHMVAMWYALLHGKVAFATYVKSQKVLNLKRDPRITLMIEDGEQYHEVRGIVIEGIATIVEGDIKLAAQVLMTSVSRQPAQLVTSDPPEQTLHAAAKRAVIIVEPERVYSWDHSKLGGTY